MTDDVNSPLKWEADYECKTDGRDLGASAPVFKRLASSGQIKPERMIVLGARSATATVVQGTSSTQTIVVFRNRVATSPE